MAVNKAENKGKRSGKNGKNGLLTRAKRKLRYVYLKTLRIDDPPERIARGIALGVLMGILPTFGIGGLISLAFAFLFRANKAASILGTFIVNPITAPIFWTFSISLGSYVLGENTEHMISMMKSEGLLSGLGWASFVFMTGNVIISIVFTLASYYITKEYVIRHRRRKAEKRALKSRPVL